MALYKDSINDACEAECSKYPTKLVTQEVYRVIDDGDCVLTTLDARKALEKLMTLIVKYDITHCWAEAEELK